MYIYPDQGGTYYRGTEQCARRAPFLILVQPEGSMCSGVSGEYPIRALIRKVALHQCGHFMMGRARAFGHSICISGAYGNDGNSRSVPQEVYDRAIPIPLELREAWGKGDGWNSAGSEAMPMAAWAREQHNTSN